MSLLCGYHFCHPKKFLKVKYRNPDWELSYILVLWKLTCTFTQITVGFHVMEFAKVSVFMYKSTHDSKNLGSLGCVILTIALPQQSLFVCAYFQISLLLYHLLTFMWTRRANCGLASIVLCCIGNHPETVWVLRRSISEWCLQNIFVDFSIYLFDLPCLFAGHLLWFHV